MGLYFRDLFIRILQKLKRSKKNDKKNFLDYKLIDHGKNLFHLCRSITGDGTRSTLEYFEKFSPEFKRIKFASGTKVFDWIIPLEWNIKDAFIQHLSTGRKYCEFKKCNLHVMGYSEPVDQIMDLDQLKKKIFTQEGQPSLIPYVTSYYSKDWGFCLSENEKKNLIPGEYHVKIDSSLSKGYLELSHAKIMGSFRKEILFSSYVCHPSLANNELSGPILINAILDFIKTNFNSTKYSYRFLLVPETIGSIAYLSKYYKKLKKRVICGFNLSCVGDEREYSHIMSPYGNNLADKALGSALFGLSNVKTYSYLDRGSDERQFCSPLINLPVCTFCKTKFGEYPEYHTNADDFSLVTEKGLQDSFDVMKVIINAFELALYPKVVYKGEPQLGKRGLYPNISQKSGDIHPAQVRMNIIAYCNGLNNVFEISKFTKLPLKIILAELSILIKEKLVIDNSRSYNQKPNN